MRFIVQSNVTIIDHHWFTTLDDKTNAHCLSMVLFNITCCSLSSKYIHSYSLSWRTCCKFHLHISRLKFNVNIHLLKSIDLGLCLYFHVEQTWTNSWTNVISIAVGIFYVAIGVFITVLTLLQSLISDLNGKQTSTTKTC
jgi:hypothetical protein